MAYDKNRDPLRLLPITQSSPARDLEPIALSDTVDLPRYTKAIKCNMGGIIYVLSVNALRRGVDLTPRKLVVLAGETVAVQAARVFATGTTATDLMGFYE